MRTLSVWPETNSLFFFFPATWSLSAHGSRHKHQFASGACFLTVGRRWRPLREPMQTQQNMQSQQGGSKAWKKTYNVRPFKLSAQLVEAPTTYLTFLKIRPLVLHLIASFQTLRTCTILSHNSTLVQLATPGSTSPQLTPYPTLLKEDAKFKKK